jgi:hypothetical protein
MGLQTLFSPRSPAGFFIPSRYAATTVLRSRKRDDALETLFTSCTPTFEQTLRIVDQFADDLLAIGMDDPPQPRWTQTWFPRLDAAVAYSLVRQKKPKHIVEIGAGHSTRFFLRAVNDGKIGTKITTIDPAPRTRFDHAQVDHIANYVQDTDLSIYAVLSPGDVLSVDAGHFLMPGSDVDFVLNKILPRLPTGVLLHFHDIFLPDPYPEAWAWRGYNEQQAVAPLLMMRAFEVVFASNFVTTRMAEAVKASAADRLPLQDGAYESSLWLTKSDVHS